MIPSIHPRVASGKNSKLLRVAITFFFVFMIISSPIFIFSNPVQVLAAINPSVDSSSYHSTPQMPSEKEDFTTQAELALTRASQTNNIVNSKTYYDIMFRTSTTGIIKTVEIDFPPGTYVGAASLVEAAGIGSGTIAASSTTATGMKITYTVTNGVNVPANTKIRIQLSNINNPQDAGNYMVAITTRNPTNAIIDGPTATQVYNIKQINTNDIADNSITSTKPSEDLMKRVTLEDDAAGNALGWNPNGALDAFTITEPAVSGENSAFVSIIVDQENIVCIVFNLDVGTFSVRCDGTPVDGTKLHYIVENLPAHVP
jgi:hypothetical protein